MRQFNRNSAIFILTFTTVWWSSLEYAYMVVCVLCMCACPSTHSICTLPSSRPRLLCWPMVSMATRLPSHSEAPSREWPSTGLSPTWTCSHLSLCMRRYVHTCLWSCLCCCPIKCTSCNCEPSVCLGRKCLLRNVLDNCCMQLLILMDGERNRSTVGESRPSDSPCCDYAHHPSWSKCLLSTCLT